HRGRHDAPALPAPAHRGDHGAQLVPARPLCLRPASRPARPALRRPPPMILLIVLPVLFLAFPNGAPAHFHGLATLQCTRTLGYRHALAWATLATLAGSLAAMIAAGGLVQRFSGKGLVADAVAADHAFLLGVAAAAALTVLLATRLGFPVSTTHALLGALVGA